MLYGCAKLKWIYNICSNFNQSREYKVKICIMYKKFSVFQIKHFAWWWFEFDTCHTAKLGGVTFQTARYNSKSKS